MRHATVLVLVCGPLLVTAGELRFAPADGAERTKTFTVEVSLEVDDLAFGVWSDGIELEWAPFALHAQPTEWLRVVLEDRYARPDGGAPRLATRTFRALHLERTDGDVEVADLGSALEGAVVERSRGADDAPRWTVVEGSHRARALALDGLREDADLRALLPGAPVEPGATWSAPGVALVDLLYPGGALPFEVAPDAAHYRPLPHALWERLSGDLELTLEESREADGAHLAVVSVDGELSAGLDLARDGCVVRVLGEDPPLAGRETERVALEVSVAGTFVWDVDAGLVHELTLDGTLAVEAHVRGQGDADDLRTSFDATWDGTLAVRLTTD